MKMSRQSPDCSDVKTKDGKGLRPSRLFIKHIGIMSEESGFMRRKDRKSLKNEQNKLGHKTCMYIRFIVVTLKTRNNQSAVMLPQKRRRVK